MTGLKCSESYLLFTAWQRPVDPTAHNTSAHHPLT